jgi:hypothetical protein
VRRLERVTLLWAVLGAVAICYHVVMSVNMHLREVPDEVHGELAARAAASGMTLRQYAIDVLSRHVEQPTMHDWLDRVARRRALALRVNTVAALAEARAEEDEARAV